MLDHPERASHPASGMSLIEVMIVVTIMGAMAALAAPDFLAMVGRHQLKAGVRELSGYLNLARMFAMNRNATVTVRVGPVSCPPASSDCGLVLAAATYAQGGGTTMAPYTMPSEVKAVGGVSQFQFNSMGLRAGGGSASQAMTFTNSRGVTFEIQVTPAGRTRWCPSSPCPS